MPGDASENGRFVWFRRLDGFGEEAIDVYLCRRFVMRVTEDEEYSGVVGRTFYLAPDKRWVECVDQVDWDEEPTPPGPDAPLLPSEVWREVDPVEVAHHLLFTYDHFRGKLPPELEPYRDQASPGRYTEWRRDHIGPGDTRPRWDEEERTLYLGSAPCKRYTREASNQFQLLRCLETNHWPPFVKNPFTHEEKLSQAVKDFNKDAKAIGFKLVSSNNRLSWKTTPKPSTPRNPATPG